MKLINSSKGSIPYFGMKYHEYFKIDERIYVAYVEF